MRKLGVERPFGWKLVAPDSTGEPAPCSKSQNGSALTEIGTVVKLGLYAFILHSSAST